MSPRIARMVVGSFRNFIVSSLTEREQEVLTLLSKGNSYKMVAELLFISHDTVRFHIKNIYKKLEVHSLPEAFAKVKKFGWEFIFWKIFIAPAKREIIAPPSNHLFLFSNFILLHIDVAFTFNLLHQTTFTCGEKIHQKFILLYHHTECMIW